MTTTPSPAIPTAPAGPAADAPAADPVAAVRSVRGPRTKGQLTLLGTPGPWRLDERTRRVGRQGVAAARATLQAARQRDLERHGHATQAA